jgi:tetratricopeptide (TPR) repeat protein
LISSIHFAGLLEAVAPFALSGALWSSRRMAVRIVLGYIAALCYFGIAITGSRGGYLSALLSLGAFAAISLYVSKKTRPRRFPVTIAITAVLLFLGVGGAVFLMKQSDFLANRLSLIPKQLEKNGLDIRIYNWQAALDQFRVAPLLGTGAGTHWYYGRYFRRTPLQSDPLHAHSDYLELLADYGMVGAFGMAAFLVVHIGRGLGALRAFLDVHGKTQYGDEPLRSSEAALNIGALTAIAAYLAHSVVDFNLHIPGHGLILAFVFGLVANPGLLPATKNKSWVFSLRWALPIVGIVLLSFGFPKFAGEYFAEKARIALRDFEFSEAVRLGNEALKYQERNPELWFHLGAAYRGLGGVADDPAVSVPYYEAAVAAFQRALALFPQDEHAVVRLAQTLGSLGRFKDAEVLYKVALVLDPNLGRIHAYYARHLAMVGREAEAEERLAEARMLAPSDDLNSIVRATYLFPGYENK